jgi:thymidylate kinase
MKIDINASLIIEGMDGTGKTSLCKEILNRDNNFSFHHFSFPIGDSLEEKFGYQRGQFSLLFDMLLANPNHKWVLDRAHIGEWLWSPKYRNRTPDYLKCIEANYFNNCSASKIIVVNVMCDPKVAIERINNRNKEGKQVEKVWTEQEYDELQESLWRCSEQSLFPKIIVDTTYTKNSVEAYALLVKELIDSRLL